MTVEEKAKLETMENSVAQIKGDVTEIKSALLGNPLSGEKGLTGQMIAFREKQIQIEKQLEILNNDKIKMNLYIKIINFLSGTAIAGAIGLLYSLIKK